MYCVSLQGHKLIQYPGFFFLLLPLKPIYTFLRIKKIILFENASLRATTKNNAKRYNQKSMGELKENFKNIIPRQKKAEIEYRSQKYQDKINKNSIVRDLNQSI